MCEKLYEESAKCNVNFEDINDDYAYQVSVFQRQTQRSRWRLSQRRNEINSVVEDESVMGIVVVPVVTNNHFAHTFQP